MDWRDYISSDSEICHGVPCIRGTRIMVSVVLDNLAAGLSTDELVREYPALTPEAILAAVAFAAEIVKERINTPPAA